MTHGLLQNRQRACTLVDLDGSSVSERMQRLIRLEKLRTLLVFPPQRLEVVRVVRGLAACENVVSAYPL